MDEAFLGTAQRIWDKLMTGQGGLVRRTTMIGEVNLILLLFNAVFRQS